MQCITQCGRVVLKILSACYFSSRDRDNCRNDGVPVEDPSTKQMECQGSFCVYSPWFQSVCCVLNMGWSLFFLFLGDDRSLSSSSSDTSHSDVSVGSRLTIWPEQSSASTSQESHGLAAAKGIHLGEEKIHPEGARGTAKPPPKPLRSRQLQEIGRQSSSDSGIATGSHSSYSGSFSSYAGSLDICHGDEFGSLLSLPLNFPSDQNLCTCPHSEPQRGVGSEYQVPSSLRHIYDIPRSLLQAAAKDVQPKSADSTLPKDQALPHGANDPKLLLPHLEAQRAPEHSQDRGRPSSLLPESTKDSSNEACVDFVSRWSDSKPPGQVSDSKSSELAPPSGASADPYDTCSPHLGMTRALFSACPICGGLKVNT